MSADAREEVGPSPQVAVATLQAAKEYLLTNGWCKDQMFDWTTVPTGDLVNTEPNWSVAARHQVPVCSLGALRVTNGMMMVSCWAGQKYLHRVLTGRGGISDVAKFNDDPSTTFNDVMDLFDEAILLAKEDEARWSRNG